VVLKQDPIALLQDFKERAMGFLFKQTQTTVSSQIVGVDIGHAHLLVLAVEKRPGSVEITHFRLEPRPDNAEAIAERLKLIFKEEGLSTFRVRTTLKSEGMVIRILSFPQMKKSEIASMLQYEVEKYIPFKANEVVLDFQILNEGIQQADSKSMEILLVAVKQSEIHQLISLFQNSGLTIEVIDVCAFALANLIEFVSPDHFSKCLAFLDMGMQSSTFGIILRGKPIFIRDISFGGGDIVKFLSRKQALVSDASAAGVQQGIREQAISGLVNEIKLSLGYYFDHIQNAEPVQILFVSGGGFRLIEDFSYLEKEIRIHTQRLDVLSRIHVSSNLDSNLLKQNQDLLESALGVCLR